MNQEGIRLMFVSTRSRSHAWNTPSKLAGQQAGKLIAKGIEKIPVNWLDAIYSYYQERFGGRIPAHLSGQLDWATLTWGNLFSSLLSHNILPLDITAAGSGPITIVEFFRDNLQIDNWDKQELEHALPIEIEYLVFNLFGAVLRRGLPYYMNLFDQRPELRPIARPSESMAARLAGRELKTATIKISSRRTTDELRPGFKLSKPGFVCNQGYRFSLSGSSSEGITFHRQCWINFDGPAKAVEYLLAGGEMSRALREDPNESVFRLVKRINSGQIQHESPKVVQNWMGDGWSTPDRPFISVTSNPGILPVIRVQGNLFIQIETNRAFPVITNIMSLAEREWLIPFVINPAEIVQARLIFPEREVSLRFHWNRDFTKLKVVCVSAQRPINSYRLADLYSLHYSFDAVKRGYEPELIP